MTKNLFFVLLGMFLYWLFDHSWINVTIWDYELVYIDLTMLISLIISVYILISLFRNRTLFIREFKRNGW